MTTEFSDVSGLSNEDLEKLIEQLQHAVVDAEARLKEEEEERRRVDKDIRACIDEKDQRMLMELQAGEVWGALAELGLVLQKNSELTGQLDDLVTNRNSEQLRKTEQHLIEKEKSLHIQCQEVRKLLAEVEPHCMTGEKEVEQQSRADSNRKGSRRKPK